MKLNIHGKLAYILEGSTIDTVSKFLARPEREVGVTADLFRKLLRDWQQGTSA